MQEPHVKGVAIHHGPESCAGWSNPLGEALSRGKHRPGGRAPKTSDQYADPVARGRRQNRRSAMVSEAGCCGVDGPGMCGHFMHENREILSVPLLGSVGEGEDPNVQHARWQEVRHWHSTEEAGEQSGEIPERSRWRKGQ